MSNENTTTELYQFIDDPCVDLHMCSETIGFLIRHYPNDKHPLEIVEKILTDKIQADAYQEDGEWVELDPMEDGHFHTTDLYIGEDCQMAGEDDGSDFIDMSIVWPAEFLDDHALTTWEVKGADLPFGSKDYNVKVVVHDVVNEESGGYEPKFKRLIVVGFCHER